MLIIIYKIPYSWFYLLLFKNYSIITTKSILRIRSIGKSFLYLAIVVVESEEIKKWVHAVLVMEHLCRKVPVEELNSIPNGLGKSRARERSSEGFKIQLKDKVAVCSGTKQKNMSHWYTSHWIQNMKWHIVKQLVTSDSKLTVHWRVLLWTEDTRAHSVPQQRVHLH